MIVKYVIVVLESALVKLQDCAAKHTMPIDEVSTKVIAHPFGEIVCEHFDVLPNITRMYNSAHSFEIIMTFTNADLMPTISMGPLRGLGRYGFKRMYFHWLDKTIPREDHIFPAELHLVFYSMNLSNSHRAFYKKDSTAILSYPIEVSSHAPNSFDAIVQQLEHVMKGDMHHTLPSDMQITLGSFAKKPEQYFVYRGSAPMLACSKNIIWIDVPNFITLSPDFVKKIEKMTSDDDGLLMDEYQYFNAPEGPVYKSEFSSGEVTDNRFLFDDPTTPSGVPWSADIPSGQMFIYINVIVILLL